MVYRRLRPQGAVKPTKQERIIDKAVELTSTTHRKSLYMGDGSYVVSPWKREGRSLVRVVAELFGFTDSNSATDQAGEAA